MFLVRIELLYHPERLYFAGDVEERIGALVLDVNYLESHSLAKVMVEGLVNCSL